MPLGAASSEGSSGEDISHFAAIRIRLRGEGSLFMSVHSINESRHKVLVPFAMKGLNRIAPTRIVNYTEQRISFELKTVNPNERFRINQIIIYSKPVFTSYPGS